MTYFKLLIFSKSFYLRLIRYIFLNAFNKKLASPEYSGEYNLISNYIKTSKINSLVLFDIGAFNGDWTHFVLNAIKKNKKQYKSILLFEPSLSPFMRLLDKFKNFNKLHVYQKIVHHYQKKNIKFFVFDSYSGTSSIFNFDKSYQSLLKIDSTTIDNVIKANKFNKINFIKCDTEGNDLNVIYGAKKSLVDKKIDIFQFEYNFRWIYCSKSLFNLFNFLIDNSLDYKFGIIKKKYIEIYDEWHPSLEDYIECNAVLICNSYHALDFMIRPMKFDKYNLPITNK